MASDQAMEASYDVLTSICTPMRLNVNVDVL